jgi:hypothetical protein
LAPAALFEMETMMSFNEETPLDSSHSNQVDPSEISMLDSSMLAVTTLAIATPADLNAIPSAVAHLPSPSNEHDIELQSDHSSHVPVVVATAIRGETNQQVISDTFSEVDKIDNSWKCKLRRGDKPLILLFFLLLLMAVMVTLHEVLPGPDENTTFVFFEYPELKLAKTTPCQKTNASDYDATGTNNRSHACQWKQIGNDLPGPTKGDFFGATLRLGGSVQGSRFSVTAPLYSMNRGLTQVYDIVESKDNSTQYSFQQIGKDILGKYENDQLKGIMSDDGHHIILSSVDATLDGRPHVGHFGSVQISPDSKHFELYGNDMYGESSNDDFGAAVVNRNGTVVAISDIQYDVKTPNNNTIVNAGVVILFYYNIESNTWTKLGQQIAGSSTEEYWGRKIALSSDGLTLAIGSRNFQDNKGKVEAYRYNLNTEEWEVMGQSIVGYEKDESVGRDLELSDDGKILAVTSNETVTIYQYNGTSHYWQNLGNDIKTDLSYQSEFGYQLSMSDDGMRLAIGEAKYSLSDEIISVGRVRVYDFIQEEQDWMLIGDIVGERSCDFVGAGFDLSPNGSRLIGEINHVMDVLYCFSSTNNYHPHLDIPIQLYCSWFSKCRRVGRERPSLCK